MEPYQERVIVEHDELTEKYVKLTAFFTTEAFGHLQDTERSFLRAQLGIMKAYLAILAERIKLF
jgi:hypothetical protein